MNTATGRVWGQLVGRDMYFIMGEGGGTSLGQSLLPPTGSERRTEPGPEVRVLPPTGSERRAPRDVPNGQRLRRQLAGTCMSPLMVPIVSQGFARLISLGCPPQRIMANSFVSQGVSHGFLRYFPTTDYCFWHVPTTEDCFQVVQNSRNWTGGRRGGIPGPVTVAAYGVGAQD